MCLSSHGPGQIEHGVMAQRWEHHHESYRIKIVEKYDDISYTVGSEMGDTIYSMFEYMRGGHT